jgi:5-methylcytosine-specific restriction endonuclease McrA
MPRKATNSPSGRDWTAFRAKVDHEGHCRIGGRLHGPPDAAHIIQRSRIPSDEAMHADNCVPLCRDCHTAYDQQRVDLLPYLSRGEQAYAVWLVGIAAAYERTTTR